MAVPLATKHEVADADIVHLTAAPSSSQHGKAAPASLCDALDRLLTTGVVVVADATLTVADVELLRLQCQIVLSSVDK